MAVGLEPLREEVTIVELDVNALQMLPGDEAEGLLGRTNCHSSCQVTCEGSHDPD
jgi:hypothetical protein